MIISGTLANAEERSYAKKDGSTGIAKAIDFITDEGNILQFGFGTIEDTFPMKDVIQLRNEPVELEVVIRGDKFDRNKPVVCATGIRLGDN